MTTAAQFESVCLLRIMTESRQIETQVRSTARGSKVLRLVQHGNNFGEFDTVEEALAFLHGRYPAPARGPLGVELPRRKGK